MRRSILGILAGHPDWQLPDEAGGFVQVLFCLGSLTAGTACANASAAPPGLQVLKMHGIGSGGETRCRSDVRAELAKKSEVPELPNRWKEGALAHGRTLGPL